MLRFIKRLTGQDDAITGEIAYEEAREKLASEKQSTRRALAQRTDLKPEMLYYLAGDDDSKTRALVAANPSTPHQANALLAEDEASEVREELARKIARLLPDLSAKQQAKLRDDTLELIEKLARDQEASVRAILAEEVKTSTLIPREIARALAEDPEITVCGPILRYSPLLSDADLIELIATTQVAGALEAIAGRQNLSADVADQVVASLDIPAVATLLANKSAAIRNSTMEEIIRNAEDVMQWHEPMAMRPDLSVRAVRRIAQFVGRDLVRALAERLNLDSETESLLAGRMNERLKQAPASETQESAAKIVQRAREQGRLDATFVSDAAEAGHTEQVAVALTLLSGLDLESVRRVLTSRNGRAVTALVWRARLPMRVSVAIQANVMHLKPPHLIPARGGSEFPLSEDEMTMLLDFFGIAA